MSSGVNGTTGLPALRPYQLGAFALSEVYLLFALCVMCVAVTKLLKIWRHDPRLRFYYGAKHHLRRNIVTYILELIVTTAIFFVYCIVGLPLLMVDPLTPMVPYADSIEVVVFFGLWLVALYLWELVRQLCSTVGTCDLTFPFSCARLRGSESTGNLPCTTPCPFFLCVRVAIILH